MTIEQLKKKLKKHEAKFDNLIWPYIVKDINDFIKSNEPISPMQVREAENLIDTLLLSAGWLHDRLEGRMATVHHPTYKRSFTKKIRKLLGYTY